MSEELAPYRTFVVTDHGDHLEAVESKRYMSATEPLLDFEQAIDWEDDTVLFGGVLVGDSWHVTGGPQWQPTIVQSS